MNSPKLGDAPPKRGNRFSRFLAQSLMSMGGWHVEAHIPDLPKMVLVGAPHTSNWDFVLAMLAVFAIGLQISWMGKHTLFRRPFAGIFKWLGGVPVDRSIRSGIVDQTIQAFHNHDKFVIGLTPAGTRTKVAKWRTGFYHIAQGANVPLVMVRFDYGRKVIGFGPTVVPTGDISKDLPEIQSIFATVKGKHSQPESSDSL